MDDIQLYRTLGRNTAEFDDNIMTGLPGLEAILDLAEDNIRAAASALSVPRDPERRPNTTDLIKEVAAVLIGPEKRSGPRW
jgi:hypothetical protein